MTSRRGADTAERWKPERMLGKGVLVPPGTKRRLGGWKRLRSGRRARRSLGPVWDGNQNQNQQVIWGLSPLDKLQRQTSINGGQEETTGMRNAASEADWCRWSSSALTELKPRDGTPESAPSWDPGRFQPSFPSCCSYLRHFLARPRTRFWFSLDQKPSPAERGRGRGGGWNKSEPDAGTRVIQHFRTEGKFLLFLLQTDVCTDGTDPKDRTQSSDLGTKEIKEKNQRKKKEIKENQPYKIPQKFDSNMTKITFGGSKIFDHQDPMGFDLLGSALIQTRDQTHEDQIGQSELRSGAGPERSEVTVCGCV